VLGRHEQGEAGSNSGAVDHEPEREQQDEGDVGEDTGHQLDVADRLEDDLLELSLRGLGEVGADLVGRRQDDAEIGRREVVDGAEKVVEVDGKPAAQAGRLKDQRAEEDVQPDTHRGRREEVGGKGGDDARHEPFEPREDWLEGGGDDDCQQDEDGGVDQEVADDPPEGVDEEDHGNGYETLVAQLCPVQI